MADPQFAVTGTRRRSSRRDLPLILFWSGALTPRINWLKERAEECRTRATLNSAMQARYLRMATAYDAHAEKVEQSEEINARFLNGPM